MKTIAITLAILTAIGWFLHYPADEASVRTVISTVIYALAYLTVRAAITAFTKITRIGRRG